MAITKIVDDMRTTVALDATKLSGTVPIANDSVTLAKMAGGTDGQVITYDASGDPVAIGPGTAGQVLTSAGANLPQTFADAGGGLHTQIGSTNDVTNVASIEWTSGISGYKTYILIGEEITAYSSDAHLRLQIGESGGYKTSGDYCYHLAYSPSNSSSYAAHNSGNSTYVRLDDGIYHHAHSTYNFTMRIHYMTGRRFSCVWNGVLYHGGGTVEGGPGKGAYLQAVTFDRFKIYTGGGNFSGRFRLFGI